MDFPKQKPDTLLEKKIHPYFFFTEGSVNLTPLWKNLLMYGQLKSNNMKAK